jgi:hypothetical protein
LQASFPPAVRCRRSHISAGGNLICACRFPAKFEDVSHANQPGKHFAMKLRIIFGVVVSLAAISSPAQTNFTIVTRTNILQAAPNFREVNGQLYNSSFSKLWQIQTGKILEVQTSGVVLQTFTTNNVYENVFVAVRLV